MTEEKEKSIIFAKRLYNDVILNPEFISCDGPIRHQFLMDKYPNFSKAYPMVIKYMAIYGQYNEIAFKQFLDKN